VPEKNKAIKLLEMIGAFPKAKTLAKRFYDHFNRNFMANQSTGEEKYLPHNLEERLALIEERLSTKG
jgi:hypothetical protein